MRSITITDVTQGISYTFNNERVLGALLNNIEGFEYPTTRITMIDLPRGGALALDSKFGRRICSFVVTLTCDVLENRRELLSVMNQDGVLKLVEFTTIDNIDLQFYAYVNKVIGTYSSMTNKPIAIELLAPDPRFYSQDLQTITTGVTTSSGGTALPTELPLSFAETSGNPPAPVELEGEENSPGTFIIRGPGTGFTVQNTTTGELFQIDTTLSTGEEITVNTLDRTVILGDNTNIYGLFSGTFWYFQPGTNLVNFHVDSGSSDTTLLTILVRDAYRGV